MATSASVPYSWMGPAGLGCNYSGVQTHLTMSRQYLSLIETCRLLVVYSRETKLCPVVTLFAPLALHGNQSLRWLPLPLTFCHDAASS